MSNVSQQQQPAAAGNIVKLIEVLQQIDTSKPTAKINETSIDDNNGERIIM